RVGGIGFLARIEPRVDPNNLDFGTGVVLVQGQLDGVDVADHFRNRERGDIADLLGLGHLRCEEAADITTLVGARQVGAKILVLLVAGGVFEGHLGKLLGDFQRRVHVAERGGEDQVVVVLGHVADHPLGVGALGHVLDVIGGDLRAEFLRQRLAPLFMLIRPAVVADRADVDETDLQRIGSAGAQADPQTDGGAQQFVQRTYLHEFELHFVVCGQGQCKLLTNRTTKQKIAACGSACRGMRNL
uniref:Uncharacterized protein n=1 Tax=Solanum lycopersicum TaxID=4081 RepID=A0A494G987_SOLLC